MMTRGVVRTALPLTLVAIALLAIVVLPSVNWADDGSDLDGDQVADEVVTDPEPPGVSPGQVTIYSGVDGSEIARITGVQAYDEFGRAVAVIGDVNGDGANDVLVGAPIKDAGEAYIFYGPPVRGGSSTFDASWADVVLFSPYDDDYAFGEAVAPLYDFDEDGLPDVRVRASVDLAGGEVGSRTFFFSGLTGELLGIVFGELSDWMWDELLGDLNLDGVVDATDLELLESRLGQSGSLTALDGDLNGDGVINAQDVNILNGLVGASLLTGVFSQTSSCQFILESGDCTHYYVCGAANQPVWWATVCRTSAESGAPLPYDTSAHGASGGEEEEGGGGYAMLGGGCPPAVCLGDIVTSATFQPPHDGFIDGADLAFLLGEWGTNPGSPADLVDSATFQPPPDGVVDGADLAVLLGNWGACDYDGDGMPDWWEEDNGFDPCIDDAGLDSDTDGLSNGEEFGYGTDPFDPDSDGDGVSDGAEVIAGADPMNPADNGIGPNSEQLFYVELYFGDHSCHNSDLWRVRVNNSTYQFDDAIAANCQEPQGMAGECSDPWSCPLQAPRSKKPVPLARGNIYELSIEWLRTAYLIYGPDYDWTFNLLLCDKNGQNTQAVAIQGGGGWQSLGWVNGVYVVNPDNILGAWYHDPGADPTIGKHATLYAPIFDIAARTIDMNQPSGYLGEDEEEVGGGAFLPVNNDDDDYDANNDPDMDQTGEIDGENDLLPIELRAVQPVEMGGNYTITIPGHVKVWTDPNRTGAVTSNTTQFDATQTTTLYVEGTAEGSNLIKLNWSKAGFPPANDVDRVRVTAFTWLGPLNVPGYSIYQYTADPPSLPGSWIDPIDGEIVSSMTPRDVNILWDSGPSVGQVVYQVNADYRWGLEVNVVRVLIKSASPTGITYNNPASQVNHVFIDTQIQGPPPVPAMLAIVDVQDISGPLINGIMRGTRKIEMGFVQNVVIVDWHADFDFTGLGVPPQQRVSINEGVGPVVDILVGGTPPWMLPSTGYFAPGDLQQAATVQLQVNDSPSIPVTDQIGITVNGVFDDVDYYSLLLDFELYFAVRTTDPANSADLTYTQRCHAQWIVDGNGSTVWQGQPALPVWQGAGENTFGDQQFEMITNGSVVPVTSGTPANSLPSGWVTVPQ